MFKIDFRKVVFFLGKLLSVLGNMVWLFNPQGSDNIGYILENAQGNQTSLKNLVWPQKEGFYNNFFNLIDATQIAF